MKRTCKSVVYASLFFGNCIFVGEISCVAVTILVALTWRFFS